MAHFIGKAKALTETKDEYIRSLGEAIFKYYNCFATKPKNLRIKNSGLIFVKLGRFKAGADMHKSFVLNNVIDAIGDHNAIRIGRKIMIQAPYWFLAPSAPGLIKRSYQFMVFGINVDHWHCIGFIAAYLAANIADKYTVTVFCL